MPRRNRLLGKTCSLSAQVSETPAAAEGVLARKNCSSSAQFSAGSPRIDGTATERLAALLQQPGGRMALSPVELLKTLQRLRSEAAAEIERLIALMDAIDADPDFEPSGDESEPSLGAAENDGSDGPPPWDYWSDKPYRTDERSQLSWAGGSTDERELCADLEEDDSHDGREPDVDDEHSGDEHEPSLGSFDRLTNQEHSYRQTSGGKDWIMFRGSDAEVEAVS